MIYLTSDLHFFHENILKWATVRHKWQTIDEMNWGLVSGWNSVVKPEDVVYNLGDLAFKTGSKINEINCILSALHGRHICLIGNHDYTKKIPLFRNVEFKEELILNIQGIDFLLKHYPYKHAMKETDTIERPNCYTNAKYKPGTSELYPLINGHVHDAYKIKRNCLNVGYDSWGRLLSEDEIIDIYKKTEKFTENLDLYPKIY